MVVNVINGEKMGEGDTWGEVVWINCIMKRYEVLYNRNVFY